VDPHAGPAWVEALLVAWCRELDDAPRRLDRLRRTLDRCSIAVRILGRPLTRAGESSRDPDRTSAVDVCAGTAALAALWEQGIGPGLVASVGTRPGLPARVARWPAGLASLEALVAEQEELRKTRHVPAIDPDPAWTVHLPGDDPLLLRVEETLGALADGEFGTRAALAEGASDSDPLTVATGCYVDGHDDGAAATPTLLPGPLWTQLEVDPAVVVGVHRVLDLRCGLLLRDGDGLNQLRELRFAALARPGTAVLRARARTGTLAGGPTLALPHADIENGVLEADETLTRARTSSARAGIETVAATETTVAGVATSVERRIVATRHTGPHREAPDPRRRPDVVPALPFEALLSEQRRAWAARWRHADVEIGGDEQLTRDVRFCLFHLMASVAETGEAAVGARGLSGRAYRGHVFWDADVFVLPFLAATHPAAARAMISYRLARLPAARAAATAAGRAGARFPWESADEGTEVTPDFAIGPEGRVIAITSGHYQEHITADVAWAASHYLDWTDDRDAEPQIRELLFDTARYWHSRATTDETGQVHLRQVMGPDEYHFPVDDNAYTNGMARWNLQRAAAAVVPTDPPWCRHEAAAWRRTARNLVDGYDPALGRHVQFAGFDRLEPVLIAELAAPPVAADALLGAERVAGTQVVKQADVLMLHHLLPDAGPRGSLTRDLEHYLPRTAHGSSLSPGIHAALLARSGRPDEAVEMLRLAARMDLDDLSQTTAGGLHLGAAGSVWQALVHGFLGVRPQRGGLLTVDPHLPASWTWVTVNLLFHGRSVRLRAGHETLRVETDLELTVRLSGRDHRLVPGATTFRLDDDGWALENG
jgi:trehalose/maltose hydrolase-like predicted phosphorylase